MNQEKGFTLIEVVIYIAIFSIMMSGVIIAIYGIFGATSRNQTKALVQEEGNFILSKIEWILTGAQIITASPDGGTLRATKTDSSGNLYSISAALDGTDMRIIREPSPFLQGQIINNPIVTISCFPVCFEHILESGNGINPENVKVKFTVSSKTSEGLSYSQEFYTIKYIRK